jgi:hypothetical protein
VGVPAEPDSRASAADVRFGRQPRREGRQPMRSKNVYGPDYKKPWVRRAFPHQRTHLGDHREQVILFVFVFALVATAILLYLSTAA